MKSGYLTSKYFLFTTFSFIFSIQEMAHGTLPHDAKMPNCTYNVDEANQGFPQCAQPDQSPFCDSDGDGTISMVEMYGAGADTNIKLRNSQNAQIKAKECKEFREQQASSGQGLFSESVITPKMLNFKSGELALTVDDGPSGDITKSVLDLLKEYNIKATFFIVGNRIQGNKQILSRMIQEGHIIGNHTNSHLVSTEATKVIPEIIKGLDAFKDFIQEANKKVREKAEANGRQSSFDIMKDSEGNQRFHNILFRPPGLAWKKLEALKMNEDASGVNQLIGPIHASIGTSGDKEKAECWKSKDTPLENCPNAQLADWFCWSKKITPEQCANGYYNEIIQRGRGIILSHDINKKTPEMLRILLKRLHTEGGGIKNKDGNGIWTFNRIDNRPELEKLQPLDRSQFIESLSVSE